jgi:homoserine O-acetyltransferase
MLKADHVYHDAGVLELEAGGTLEGFQLKYTTLGQLNADRSNVVWVCHALTGSSDVTSWWTSMFESGSPLDPQHHFIICANVLGGCYGSTGPLSVNPKTKKPFYHTFPLITNRDTVRAFDRLRVHLGIDQIQLLIGGSLGGQQVLEWAVLQPRAIRKLVAIACNAVHSPWGIAFNEAQRMAIAADATWMQDEPRAGIQGMKAARAMGMISFRTYDTFQQTQSEKTTDTLTDFRAATYQRYQGEKLANRFNAFSYYTLLNMMDAHHLGRQRTEVGAVLQSIQAETLVVGIDSDLLFPFREQELLATFIPKARLEIIRSKYGHDGFLIEFDQFKNLLFSFLRKAEQIPL